MAKEQVTKGATDTDRARPIFDLPYLLNSVESLAKSYSTRVHFFPPSEPISNKTPVQTAAHMYARSTHERVRGTVPTELMVP